MYKLPKQVKYKGEVYSVDASVNNVLEIMEWLEDDSLDDIDRAVMLVTKIFGVNAPVEQTLINEGLEIIRLGKPEEEHKHQERDMDFRYDYATIRMDIIREYNVDIAKNNVDWDWLVYAIENLGKDSVLNNKRMYRTLKLSDYKDPKQRKEMKAIKDAVALPKEEYTPIDKEKVYDDSKMDNIISKLIKKGG